MRNCKSFMLTVFLLLCSVTFTCCAEELSGDPSGNGDGNHNGNNDTDKDTTNYNLVDFPEGYSPIEIGQKLTNRFITVDYSTNRTNKVNYSFWGNIYSTNTPDHVTYPDVCAWLGALWFADAVKNDNLYNGVVKKFDPLFTTDVRFQPSLRPSASNIVDYYVFGAVPLQIYQRKQESKYYDLGMKYADGQWTLPSNATQTQKDWHDKGYSWQTRLWIDDMFMITALQAQAYHATGDEKYRERTIDEMVLYLDEIQRDNGLFYHAPNAPFYWARGNGWMAAGMVEVLKLLPADHKHRQKIMNAYIKMMKELAKYQRPDGMWSQLIDHPNTADMWAESSGSAMFTYAMISGVKNGWLEEEKYGTVARKGWLALVSFLDRNFDITEVCEGTGVGYSYEYYRDRRRWIGDTHGLAAMLWSAYALILPTETD